MNICKFMKCQFKKELKDSVWSEFFKDNFWMYTMPFVILAAYYFLILAFHTDNIIDRHIFAFNYAIDSTIEKFNYLIDILKNR